VSFTLTCYRPDWVVHGGCVGADLQFADLALRLGDIRSEVWPADIGAPLPDWLVQTAIEIKPAKAPLVRNRDIVTASEMMIACPAQPDEIQRSGTWATYRYARAMGKPVKLVAPSGYVTMHPVKGWKDPFTGKVRDPL
jgi:hypothetical protein